jgi:hypothetical protein
MRLERATFTSSPLVSFPIIVQHRSFRTAKEKKKKGDQQYKKEWQVMMEHLHDASGHC